MAAAGVHNDADGFIYDKQVFVFVHDVYRAGLGLDACLRAALGEVDGYHLTGLHDGIGSAEAAIEHGACVGHAYAPQDGLADAEAPLEQLGKGFSRFFFFGDDAYDSVLVTHAKTLWDNWVEFRVVYRNIILTCGYVFAVRRNQSLGSMLKNTKERGKSLTLGPSYRILVRYFFYSYALFQEL